MRALLGTASHFGEVAVLKWTLKAVSLAVHAIDDFMALLNFLAAIVSSEVELRTEGVQGDFDSQPGRKSSSSSSLISLLKSDQLLTTHRSPSTGNRAPVQTSCDRPRVALATVSDSRRYLKQKVPLPSGASQHTQSKCRIVTPNVYNVVF